MTAAQDSGINRPDQGRGVIDGAFRLLSLLPEVTGDHQLNQLAELSGIPRPSVYRLMSQLQHVGAVDLVGRRYVVGPSITELARRAEPAKGLRDRALPYMSALRQRSGACVSLVAPASQGAVILEVLPGRDQLPVHIHAGRVLPDLAAASLILNAAEVPDRVDPVRRTAVDHQHIVPGLHCFAAAITLPDGGRAALQIATNEPITSPDDLRLAQEASHRIGAALRADAAQ
ncbi:helix-turn-helix domain-containing protein [Actinoplanes sp. NPDC089786]|uniref:helix-turn-helix domain-containing protein n=1 Tax=Actinoplanes sp. NPDC089786 TaxID=3155185 RepID=UPI00343478F5